MLNASYSFFGQIFRPSVRITRERSVYAPVSDLGQVGSGRVTGRKPWCRFDLDERSPEELSRTGLVFAGEELDSGGDELLETELTVVVGVDRLERVAGHLRVESDDVEEQLELVLLDHAVRVGVDGPEKQRQRTGQRLTQRRVLHLFLEGGDERVLIQRLARGTVLQVLLPHL